MKYTDKDIYLEPKLVDKLNLMIKRMTGKGERDNVLLIDGNEGDGKSNMASAVAYYVAYKTQRPLTLATSMFFDLDKLIQHATHSQEQIIIWDEAALGGLAAEWWKKNQIEFVKLLMVARKKRHFFIICIPKFHKLNEYLAVDRSIGMIHVYSANELEQGRFVYYTKDKKEKLYENWRKTRVKNYRKYFSFHGRFTITLPKVFNKDGYEKMKDEAILTIGKDNTPRHTEVKKKTVTLAIKKLRDKGVELKNKEWGDVFQCSTRNIEEYNRYIRENPSIFNPQTT